MVVFPRFLFFYSNEINWTNDRWWSIVELLFFSREGGDFDSKWLHFLLSMSVIWQNAIVSITWLKYGYSFEKFLFWYHLSLSLSKRKEIVYELHLVFPEYCPFLLLMFATLFVVNRIHSFPCISCSARRHKIILYCCNFY